MSGAGRLVTVFGGSGFVGRHVVRALARRGWRVRAAVRRPDLAFHLQPLGNVGQIHAVQANLRYPESVAAAVAGADAAVNCVGILFEAGRQNFDAVQSFGARSVARAATDAGIDRLVHISAIGANSESDSGYARTKAGGEAAVLGAGVPASVMRPSIVFGPEDDFFNRFASMSRIAPALPLIDGGTTRFQPVYVGDVAEAVARSVEGSAETGKIYELGGPRVATFRECLELMLEITGRNRLLLPLPAPAAKLMGRLTGWLPSPPITVDQVRLLAVDNVVSDSAKRDGRTLAGLGIQPTAMEAILPTYLRQYRKAGQFTELA